MKILSLFLSISLLISAFRAVQPTDTVPKAALSDYGFFRGSLATQQPADGVLPYALNTPLFSDYAEKLRFIQVPAGQTVPYNAKSVLDFPVGTTLIKTFYYPTDARNPANGRRLLETRLLIHEPGGWKALDYVWNDEQTDALLEVAGDTKAVRYTDGAGRLQQHEYVIPNQNQCKGCHNQNEQIRPIGPSVRQLNGDLTYDKTTENQLLRWQRLGLLTGLPAIADCPKAPVWNRPETGSVADRARIYVDINCAHCHNPSGPAQTSGLNLSIHETDLTALGILKTPVAAGRGSGNRRFDIVPQRPDQSILVYRMESTDAGEMMPEVGRRRVHQEGVALVRAWIKELRP
jgi:uncharacterized repeat protein (TIGR03806 family)